MSTVIFLSLHDLGVMFLFGAFVAGTGLLLAEVAWRLERGRYEHAQRYGPGQVSPPNAPRPPATNTPPAPLHTPMGFAKRQPD